MVDGYVEAGIRRRRSQPQHYHATMKVLGLIGGTGTESTIDYYRLLVAKYREQADGHSPALIITSVDLKQMVDLMTAGQLDTVADYLTAEFERLHKAGADFAALT